jgi:hypothetical protein
LGDETGLSWPYHPGRAESPALLDSNAKVRIEVHRRWTRSPTKPSSASFSLPLPGKDTAYVAFGDAELTGDGARGFLRGGRLERRELCLSFGAAVLFWACCLPIGPKRQLLTYRSKWGHMGSADRRNSLLAGSLAVAAARSRIFLVRRVRLVRPSGRLEQEPGHRARSKVRRYDHPALAGVQRRRGDPGRRRAQLRRDSPPGVRPVQGYSTIRQALELPLGLVGAALAGATTEVISGRRRQRLSEPSHAAQP